MMNNNIIFIDNESIVSSECSSKYDYDNFDYQQKYLEAIIQAFKNDKINNMECYINNLIEIEKMKDDFRNQRTSLIKN